MVVPWWGRSPSSKCWGRCLGGSVRGTAAQGWRPVLGLTWQDAPMTRLPGGPPERLARAGVTEREAEVLSAVAERLHNREIADRLYISVRTVESHISALLRKLGVTDRAALVELGAELGRAAQPGTALPVPLTSFVGRERETNEVATLLQGHRLLTLTGPAGAGKTRLALQVAAAGADRLPGDVRLADLAAVGSADLVADTLARALGISPQPTRPVRDSLRNAARETHCLLVVDNCEHVVAEAAALVSDLLTAGGQLRVLATSREVLGVPGEVSYEVEPLPVPLRLRRGRSGVRHRWIRRRRRGPAVAGAGGQVAGVHRRRRHAPLPAAGEPPGLRRRTPGRQRRRHRATAAARRPLSGGGRAGRRAATGAGAAGVAGPPDDRAAQPACRAGPQRRPGTSRPPCAGSRCWSCSGTAPASVAKPTSGSGGRWPAASRPPHQRVLPGSPQPAPSCNPGTTKPRSTWPNRQPSSPPSSATPSEPGQPPQAVPCFRSCLVGRVVARPNLTACRCDSGQTARGQCVPQGVEMAHQLGQGAGGAHGRGVGTGGFEQAKYLKLLGVFSRWGRPSPPPPWPSWPA
jgi:DNA-binding CsgD family transcriptional regulator